jgi:hypothetical protein
MHAVAGLIVQQMHIWFFSTATVRATALCTVCELRFCCCLYHDERTKPGSGTRLRILRLVGDWA